MPTWECTALLSSRGPAGDGMLQSPDQLLATRLATDAEARSVECEELSAWEHPGPLPADPVPLLLLFQYDFDEARDAEIGLKIHSLEAKVYLREKDPLFRLAWILALTEQAD